MTKRSLLGIFFSVQLAAATIWAAEPPVIAIWPGDAPGSEGKATIAEKVRLTEEDGEHVVSSVHRPSLTVYLPPAEKRTGAAVVICPGGGHRELWMDHEGYNIARWLAERGIAAFVLKYRLAREEGSTYQIATHSLADLQRAMRLVRTRAKEWNVDPARVGVMGFSAGGELAALAGMKSTGPDASAADPIGRENDKPAFQALIYPGNSGAIAPTKDSPPAFLVAGYGDRPDISEGIARVYLKFKEAGVLAELHIYAGAGHGFGVRARNKTPSAAWPERFREWLGDRGFLAGAP
jgi:acetyl esterase/lipase